MSATPYRCGAGTGPCGADARLYPGGWRCPAHTPAAENGRPEPEPGPGYTPQDYRLAQAATGRTTS